MNRAALILAAGLLVYGCGAAADRGESEAVPPGRIDSSSAVSADSVIRGDSEWHVTPEGAGSVHIGMTVQELLPHVEAGADTAGLGDGCSYVQLREAPDSTGFMVEAGRLVRIDVYGGDTVTPEGAGVGDSETRILELYPDARRGPHKYTDGFYLTVLPDAPADTMGRYVFETDGERVTRYRAGVIPPVEYVEGCS